MELYKLTFLSSIGIAHLGVVNLSSLLEQSRVMYLERIYSTSYLYYLNYSVFNYFSIEHQPIHRNLMST